MLGNIALPAKEINWQAEPYRAQLTFVPKGNARAAFRPTAENESPGWPWTWPSQRENCPISPPHKRQTWARRDLPAARLPSDSNRDDVALTPGCTAIPTRAPDAGERLPHGDVRPSSAINTLLTAAVGMVIQPHGSWPQKMLLLAGVSLSAAGVRAERGITPSHSETDNSPPGDDDRRLAPPLSRPAAIIYRRRHYRASA